MITVGVDIGSLTGKAIVLRDNAIASWSLIPTGYDSAETANSVIGDALGKANVTEKEVDYIVSTGYGRVVVPQAKKNMTEISCHARGAIWLNPDVRTILDMGGQDCKAIRCDASGNITDFIMNDKCAAGAGRYLEVVAQVLDLHLEDIGPASLEDQDNALTISSMCAVFARSEIIRALRQGEKKNNILAGAHDALSIKVLGLLNKVGIQRELMISGGIAKNAGIVRRIEDKVGFTAKIANEPQVVGALGAALFAVEFFTRGGQ